MPARWPCHAVIRVHNFGRLVFATRCKSPPCVACQQRALVLMLVACRPGSAHVTTSRPWRRRRSFDPTLRSCTAACHCALAALSVPCSSQPCSHAPALTVKKKKKRQGFPAVLETSTVCCGLDGAWPGQASQTRRLVAPLQRCLSPVRWRNRPNQARPAGGWEGGKKRAGFHCQCDRRFEAMTTSKKLVHMALSPARILRLSTRMIRIKITSSKKVKNMLCGSYEYHLSTTCFFEVGNSYVVITYLYDKDTLTRFLEAT